MATHATNELDAAEAELASLRHQLSSTRAHLQRRLVELDQVTVEVLDQSDALSLLDESPEAKEERLTKSYGATGSGKKAKSLPFHPETPDVKTVQRREKKSLAKQKA